MYLFPKNIAFLCWVIAIDWNGTPVVACSPVTIGTPVAGGTPVARDTSVADSGSGLNILNLIIDLFKSCIHILHI